MRIRKALTAVLLVQLAACAAPTAPTTTSTTEAVVTTDTTVEVVTTTTTVASSTTTTAVATVFLIRVRDGVKTEGLDTLSVRVGEQAVFDVEADVADEVHVHGYDLHFDVVPGAVTRVEFTAESTGIFEVELEGLALHIVDIEVTP